VIFEPIPLLMVAATWYLAITAVLMVGQFYWSGTSRAARRAS